MAAARSLFWNDLARDLEDPEFLREYVVESVRIATVDRIVNALDEAREAAGLTKADLARAISVDPAAIRRLFNSTANPTLSRISEVAAALGLRITVERLPAAERRAVTKPLREGKAGNKRDLVDYHAGMRAGRRPPIPA
jgi:transcriptional regulator with XRE-family HTH domain